MDLKPLAALFLFFCFLTVASSSPTTNGEHSNYEIDATQTCQKFLPNFRNVDGAVISIPNVNHAAQLYGADITVVSKELNIVSCSVFNFIDITGAIEPLYIQMEVHADINITQPTRINYTFRAHMNVHFEVESNLVTPKLVQLLSPTVWYQWNEGEDRVRPDAEHTLYYRQTLIPFVTQKLNQLPSYYVSVETDQNYLKNTFLKMISDLTKMKQNQQPV